MAKIEINDLPEKQANKIIAILDACNVKFSYVGSPPPKPYVPLGELSIRDYNSCSSVIHEKGKGVVNHSKDHFIALLPNYAEGEMQQLLHQNKHGMRAISMLRHIVWHVKRGREFKISQDSDSIPRIDQILADLDKGPKE